MSSRHSSSRQKEDLRYSRRESNLRRVPLETPSSSRSSRPRSPARSNRAPSLNRSKNENKRSAPALNPPSNEDSYNQVDQNMDEEDIIFLCSMSDPKAETRTNEKRDTPRTGGENRRNQQDRHGGPRRDGSRGGQKRNSNGNQMNNSGRYNNSMNSNFSSQLRGSELKPQIPMNTAFTQEIPKKKFTTRCRLFVGNLPNEMKEEEFKELFKEFGEISEIFLSGKGFGFLRLDTRAHAESAKENLDGKTVKGRQLRVRFAVNGATIRIKELSTVVSNEMLYNTFSIFGDVERAVHIVDERGKPTGEGIVEFERKATAQDALRNIEERVFMMTAHSHPIFVEILEPKDEEDGLAERMIQRNAQSAKEREIPPHFADERSFEHSYGLRWKELYKFEKAERERLEENLREKRRQLQSDMEIAYEDYQAEKIRDELEQRRRELDRLEEARRNRVRQIGERPPDFNNSWSQNQPPRQFDEFHNQNMLLPYGHPPVVHPPSLPQGPPPTFDGPHGRPATFGREPPRFFGGPSEDADLRGHRPPGDPDQKFGPEIEKILQTFRGNEDGVRQNLNKSLGFNGNEGPYQGPPHQGPPHGGPPFNAPLVPPLFTMPSGRQQHKMMPPEKRRR